MMTSRDLNPRDRNLPWLHIDFTMVLSVIGLAIMGLIVIYSATRGADPETFDTSFLERQSSFVILGLVIMAVIAIVPYDDWRRLAVPVFVVSMLVMVAVLTPLGVERNGAHAWFEVGSFQMQPSEFTKVTFILAMASFLARFDGPLSTPHLAMALGLAGLPAAVLLLQPDVGTLLVFVAITMGMLLVGGIQVRHIVGLSLVGVVGLGMVMNSTLLKDYQRDRLVSFIDPDSATQDAAYNQVQAQIAIGNGGLRGQGFGQGGQTIGGLVPEQQTDFIFTVVGEEFGFIGGAIVLGLFGLLIWRLWRIAKVAGDSFGALVSVGVLTMVMFQMFESVGMTMGIMPITGIPLPFISYGGSSALASFAAVGFALNVHMRRYL